MIELLIAMAIAGVLATLLFPVAGQMRKRADNVTCVSNLRQIGLGILNYTQDHEGRLPGPLLIGQYTYKEGYPFLSSALREYVDVSTSFKKSFRDDVFVCPANRRSLGRYFGYSPPFGMNAFVRFRETDKTVSPFGYANSYHSALFGQSADTPPLLSHRLADIVDEQGAPAQASTWALMDIDQQCEFSTFKEAVRYDLLPTAPVHDHHRNGIFFDFHVGPVPLARNIIVPAAR